MAPKSNGNAVPSQDEQLEGQVRDLVRSIVHGVLDEAECFDAGLFGYSPREAELLDPQGRVFLECAWEALERAGCDPKRFGGQIGVYGGQALDTYLFNIMSRPDLLAMAGGISAMMGVGVGSDYLPMRVSYKLDLQGPSVNVQTGCSTSLVAVHAACQGLMSRDCDFALAGGRVEANSLASAGQTWDVTLTYDYEVPGQDILVDMTGVADITGATGIGGPPLRQTGIGSQQLVNVVRAAADTDTMPDLRHDAYTPSISHQRRTF